MKARLTALALKCPRSAYMASVPVTQRMAPESISQAVVPPSVKKLKALSSVGDGRQAVHEMKVTGSNQTRCVVNAILAYGTHHMHSC